MGPRCRSAEEARAIIWHTEPGQVAQKYSRKGCGYLFCTSEPPCTKRWRIKQYGKNEFQPMVFGEHIDGCNPIVKDATKNPAERAALIDLCGRNRPRKVRKMLAHQDVTAAAVRSARATALRREKAEHRVSARVTLHDIRVSVVEAWRLAHGDDLKFFAQAPKVGTGMICGIVAPKVLSSAVGPLYNARVLAHDHTYRLVSDVPGAMVYSVSAVDAFHHCHQVAHFIINAKDMRVLTDIVAILKNTLMVDDVRKIDYMMQDAARELLEVPRLLADWTGKVIKPLTCVWHVMRAVRRRTAQVDADTMKAFMKYVYAPVQSDAIPALEKTLMENPYLKSQWMTGQWANSFDVRCRPAGLPMTNNAHENMNRDLKLAQDRTAAPLVGCLENLKDSLLLCVRSPPPPAYSRRFAGKVPPQDVIDLLNVFDKVPPVENPATVWTTGPAPDAPVVHLDDPKYRCTCQHYARWAECAHGQAVQVRVGKVPDPRAGPIAGHEPRRPGRPKAPRLLEARQCQMPAGASVADAADPAAE